MKFRSRGAFRLRARSALTLMALVAAPVAAQQQAPSLALDSAVQLALRAHPRVAAARAAVTAAEARTRQAAARANPTLSWQYERTSRAGAENSQHITTLEQPLAFGQRNARRDVAAAEQDAATADLLAAELEITFLATSAYATVLEAERRHAIATRSAAAFAEAARIVDARLAAGDASGYEQRRVQLEAARYAAVREARAVEARRARRALLALIDPAGAERDRALTLSFGIAQGTPPELGDDSLVARGMAQRPDLRAADARLRAQEAQLSLASWERLPVPTLVGGLKSETAAGLGSLRGMAAGVSIPLPLFDRRTGARDAAVADVTQAQQQLADRRQVATLEILAAADAVRSAELQLSALRPALGENAERALVAVNAAFAEGDISLDSWLLALRAYDEAEDAFALLRADAIVRRAELARALGQPSLQ
jgi:cobalt-zinc-cadmium efflux system outer membrane protein